MLPFKQVLLNIDWDYFFPDVSDYDFGHRESEFFIDGIWELRADAVSMIGHKKALDYLVPKYDYFWNELKVLNIEPTDVFVSETHAHSITWWNEKVNGKISPDLPTVMTVFDQHLDMYPLKEYTDCGNWLLKMLSDMRGCNQYLQVYVVMPKFAIDNYNKKKLLPKEYESQVKLLSFSEFKRMMKSFQNYSTTAFICRSGAWTPPWCDDQFDDFLKKSGAKIEMYEYLSPKGIEVAKRKRGFHKGSLQYPEEYSKYAIQGIVDRERNISHYRELSNQMKEQLQIFRSLQEKEVKQ